MRCPAARRPAATGKRTHGRTEETTNYEISKKVTTSTVDGGDIKKLSVAVVVDGVGDAAARTTSRAAPRDGKITAGEIGDGL
jgi:flagellar M-ring protein FliF